MINIRMRSLVYSMIGLVAGGLVGYQQWWQLAPEVQQQVLAQLGAPVWVWLIAGVQTALLVAVSSLIGLRAAIAMGMQVRMQWQYHALGVALLCGSAVAALILSADAWIFAPRIASLPPLAFSALTAVANVLYGGIVEEILIRLFVMTAVVWLLTRFVVRQQTPPHGAEWVYWGAIGVSALLFALGHYPATVQLIGMSPVILLRMLVLNGIGGVVYGYLYWRYGLGYAMVAHMSTHVVMQGWVWCFDRLL